MSSDAKTGPAFANAKKVEMARRGRSSCLVCDSLNTPSVCAPCINIRLAEKYKRLQTLIQERDALRQRVDIGLNTKIESSKQQQWRLEHSDYKNQLKENLLKIEKQLSQGKVLLTHKQKELNSCTSLFLAARAQLEAKQSEQNGRSYPNLEMSNHEVVSAEVAKMRKQVMRQLCKVLPMRMETGNSRRYIRICGTRLPLDDDLSLVDSRELSASLGYLVQLVNLAARYLSAPLLHRGIFAASSSRIWQRTSYYDARPASRSEEYPLFVPDKYRRANGNEESSSDKCTGDSSFLHVEKLGSGKVSSSSTGDNRDVRKGLTLLKQTIGCVCAYGYALSSLPRMHRDTHIFEDFADLLFLLSSNEKRIRSNRDSSQSNKDNLFDGWDGPSLPGFQKNRPGLQLKAQIGAVASNDLLHVSGRFDGCEFCEKNENMLDGWDMVERLPLPPPPSRSEDVEHWTRAMFVDATNLQARADHIDAGCNKVKEDLLLSQL